MTQRAADRSQLLQTLHSRLDAIADSWYQAIARVSFLPLEAGEVRRRLTELTEQTIAILDTEPLERDKAQAIGAALAQLTHAQPDALGRTQEVLGRLLLEAAPTEQVVALQPSLVTLFGAMANGFLQQARDTILTEQEQIRRALVSGIRRAEEALRESETRYRTLFENAPIGMGVVDASGKVLAVNDALLDPLGYTREDIAGMKSIADMCYDPDERDRVLAVIDTQGFLHQREMRIKRKDGAYCHMLLGLVPITWKGKRCWQVMALDVTARKRTERQASRAERMAAIGLLATSLAHEVNNPLQAMRSNLELMQDFDLEPDEQAGYLDVVLREIERLSKITRRVLDFAQPSDETRLPVSVACLTERALELLSKQMEIAHIRTTTDLPADLPPVFVAPDQIGQVLLNLTVNAIEAVPDGGHLHITARVDGDVVAIALSNDGPPIPSGDIERIFDPFFTTKPGGTGMGLPISHNIVHRHGGTISVENLEGGQGVAFTVTLPIARIPR